MTGSGRPGRRHICIVVQNLPVPFDRRVWLECRALIEAGYEVSVVCPKAPGDPSYEELDGVHLSLPAFSAHYPADHVSGRVRLVDPGLAGGPQVGVAPQAVRRRPGVQPAGRAMGCCLAVPGALRRAHGFRPARSLPAFCVAVPGRPPVAVSGAPAHRACHLWIGRPGDRHEQVLPPDRPATRPQRGCRRHYRAHRHDPDRMRRGEANRRCAVGTNICSSTSA